jgi:protein phosphatase
MTRDTEPNPGDEVSFSVGARTDVGRKRRHNEDSILVREDLGLLVVADGMGGHLAGDQASQLAVRTIEEFLEQTTNQWEPTPPPRTHAELDAHGLRLLYAVMHANRVVHEAALATVARHGMGTTVVAALITRDGMIRVAHVGDSRCYRISNSEIEQITQDHSFVNDVRWSQPDVDDEIVASLPKNVITRALGTKPTVDVDIRSELTLPGDAYLLCSDGLSGMVSAEAMLRAVDDLEDPQTACDLLIERANMAGGKDNVSVIVVRVEELEDTIPILPPPSPEAPLLYDEKMRAWCCARCGSQHVPGTKFCVECGTSFLPARGRPT